jgi:hypothetical protein
MTETEGGKPAVATTPQKALKDDSPENQPGETTIIFHEETGGLAIVRRRAYELTWAEREWVEVDPDKERDKLKKIAEDMGVVVFDNMKGRRIAESIVARRQKLQREA